VGRGRFVFLIIIIAAAVFVESRAHRPRTQKSAVNRILFRVPFYAALAATDGKKGKRRRLSRNGSTASQRAAPRPVEEDRDRSKAGALLPIFQQQTPTAPRVNPK